jgi:DNA polymerase-3 subunit epsilon
VRLSQEIQSLEWEETAGELGALLRESELVKTQLPAHNVALRRRLNQVLLAIDDDGRVSTTPAIGFDLARLGTCYGPFGSRASVRRFLVGLASEHGLCLKTMGLEGRRKAAADGTPCFNQQLPSAEEPASARGARPEHAARS